MISDGFFAGWRLRVIDVRRTFLFLWVKMSRWCDMLPLAVGEQRRRKAHSTGFDNFIQSHIWNARRGRYVIADWRSTSEV